MKRYIRSSADFSATELVPRQRTARDGKTWWVVYDTATHKYLDTILYFGKYKTKKECQYAIDRAVEKYGDELARTISNHRKYFSDVNSCGDIKASNEPKYFANMVSASYGPESEDGYEQLVDVDDEYKYYVAGYFDNLMRGLSDNLSTDSFDAALDFAHNMASEGCFVEIKNLITGEAQYYDSNVWMDNVERGSIPEEVYELA